ncbi:MAG: DUF2924 domain-containing protein [Proteobacteria bacterium]|nr:DUF2924 domain-containing protein [Pseudomonadota bacterium]
MPGDSDTDVEAEVARLGDLGLDGLRSRWRSEFGRVAPIHLSKHLLLRLLAYRLQAQTFGDLSPATRRLLDGLAKERKPSDGETVAVPLPGEGQLMTGTMLVREHDDQQHHVMVTEDGFVWNGITYPSLSKVAYAITGTKWNGPRFFGLRGKVVEEQQ